MSCDCGEGGGMLSNEAIDDMGFELERLKEANKKMTEALQEISCSDDCPDAFREIAREALQ